MKRLTLLISAILMTGSILMQAQVYKFDFSIDKKVKDGYIKVTSETLFNNERGYGYDLLPSWDGKSNQPFFFSLNVPDGNYKVTVTLGSKKEAASTTVRGESRRLFVENLSTKKGEMITETFTINKRNPVISGKERVSIKEKEKKKLNWDDKLTLEFNGDLPRVNSLVIERVENIPTVYLCGNSTVVDQDNEPWASWGQMIPRFFTDQVCIANHAESGLSANTFIGGKRLAKILSQIKEGDYLLVEFGHNDQKQKGPGKGAFYSFAYNLKIFIDEARAKGAHPILVTPTSRRRFDENGKSVNTHGDYPEGYVPTFHFDIVKKIKDATGAALVLHGGSGAGEKNIRLSVEAGINKINVGTDYMIAQRSFVADALSKNPQYDWPQLVQDSWAAGVDTIKRYIELSGSAHKAF